MKLIIFLFWVISLSSCDIVNDVVDQASEEARDQTSSTVNGALPIEAEFSEDPLFGQQWYLVNTGQKAFSAVAGVAGEDMNIQQTLSDKKYRGSGVIVAVVDEGLEASHEDLEANVSLANSHNFLNDSNDPTNSTSPDHGTTVAGVIGAPLNGKGIQGVANKATLVGYNIIISSLVQNFDNFMSSLGQASYSENVDVFNMSFGISSTSPVSLPGESDSDLCGSTSNVNYYVGCAAYYGVNNLRDKLGAIYVKSSGNGFTRVCLAVSSDGSCSSYAECDNANDNDVTCENSNNELSQAYPHTIVVGAVNANGVKSSYSTAGSSVWITAPGGEFGYFSSSTSATSTTFQPAMVTTDQSSCSNGYAKSSSTENLFKNNSNGENDDCNYTTITGTSFSAPVISGVAALLLDANPNLAWRDVKHILANTADKIDSNFSSRTVSVTGGDVILNNGWVTNSAGYHFHNWYGFGRVNVDNAIAAAENYSSGSLGTFSSSSWFNDDGSIEDATVNSANADGAQDTISVSSSGISFIEAVQIAFTHSGGTNPTNLNVTLTHDGGTESVLLNSGNLWTSSGTTDLPLLSNAFYGESADGSWELKIQNPESGSTTLSSWKIRFYGH